DSNGIEEDEHVEKNTHVLHVIQVVFEFTPRIEYGRAIRITYLRPTGESGLNHETFLIVRHFLCELRDHLGTLGAWADERHVAAQDMPELRDFIDAIPAEEAADKRDPRVIFFGPFCAIPFCIDAHRAQLRHAEWPA